MSNKSKCTIFEIRRPENVYIKPKRNILCETVHEIWKSRFLFFDSSHFEYCNKLWKHQHLRLLPSKFCNSMVSSSSVPNFMLLSSSENVWPFLTLRALTIRRSRECKTTSCRPSRTVHWLTPGLCLNTFLPLVDSRK